MEISTLSAKVVPKHLRIVIIRTIEGKPLALVPCDRGCKGVIPVLLYKRIWGVAGTSASYTPSC